MASSQLSTLRLRDEFDWVFQHHSCKISVHGLYLMSCETQRGCVRLGMVIPKKVLKLAVTRNSLKRQIRRAVREKLAGYSIDCVVVATRGLSNYAKEDFANLVAVLFTKFAKSQAKLPTAPRCS